MRSQNFSIIAFFLLLLASPLKADGAMLTYSFDDGHISVYSLAYPILSGYGQVGTANVIANTVEWANNGEATRVNSSQLLEMQESSWEICSHSKTHPHFSKIPQAYDDELITGWVSAPGTTFTYKADYNYDQLPFVLEDGSYLKRRNSITEVDNSPGSHYFEPSTNTLYIHTTDNAPPLNNHEIRADSVQRELEISKNELTAMGLDIRSFVVPYSDWSEERKTLAMQYYDSVAGGYHEGWFNSIPPGDLYWIARKPIGADTTVEEVEAWVREAIDNDEWLVLMLHKIGEEGWPEERLEGLAAWMATQDIQVVTQQQAVELMTVPIPSSLGLCVSGILILFVFFLKRNRLDSPLCQCK